MEEAAMRRWVRVMGASAVLAGGLAVIPVTASSASNAAAGDAADAGWFVLTAAQLPLLLVWLAVGVAGIVIALILLSVARRRARVAVSAVTAEHRVADAAVPAA